MLVESGSSNNNDETVGNDGANCDCDSVKVSGGGGVKKGSLWITAKWKWWHGDGTNSNKIANVSNVTAV